MFRDFEHRGEVFRQAVRDLAARRGSGWTGALSRGPRPGGLAALRRSRSRAETLRALRLTRGWRTLLPASRRPRGARADRWLLAIDARAWWGWAIVMIYSASAIRAQERFGDPTFFLKKQAIWAALGLLAMVWAVDLGPQAIPAA